MRVFSVVLTQILLTMTASAFSQVAEPTSLTAEDLWSAAKLGDCQRIQMIVDAGVAVDAKTSYGATALAFAAEKGHLEAVELLIKSGADVNNKDSFYHATPYSWASMSGHADVAKAIKEAGGDAGFGAVADTPTKDEKNDVAAKEVDETTATSEPEAADEASAVQFPIVSAEKIALDDLEACGPHWPQFRGNAGRGIADGHHPPLRWNATDDKNIKWKTAIPGLGHSCPVIWGDRIFLTSAVSKEGNAELTIGQYGGVDSVDDNTVHQFVVYCIDRDTGAIRWSKIAKEGTPTIKRHLKSTHANPSVATNGQCLVAMFGSEGLYCYTMEGELLWQKSFGTLDSGWFYDDSYQWGFGSSPVIWKQTVIVQCDVQKGSFVAAFNLSNGAEVWRVERDEIPSWSTPAVCQTPIGGMLITNGTNGIRGYDVSNGEELWSLTGNSEIVVPTPFLAYDTIFVTAGYSPIQPIYAITWQARGDISLKEGQDQNAFIRWSRRKGGPYMPTPLAYRGRLYCCSNGGILACYDALTGEQLYQQRLKLSGTRSFVGSPIAADGNLFVPGEDGNIVVVKAGDEFEQICENPLGEYVLSTPAIVDGVIYVRGQNHLFAITEQGELDGKE